MVPVKFLLLMLSSVAWALPTDFNRERRPYHGRPFKAIVVTSKPFGYAPNNEDNAIRNRVSTTPATPTTTGSSFEYKIAQPTIPFFSISCSVGSSCSQIISARKVPTPKPTFKPYTKEEREKFKLAYNQVFGPTALLTASLSEKAPSSTKSTRTTTTTPKPAVSTGVWRVRTTTSPSYIRPTTPRATTTTTTTTLATKAKPTLSSAIKEFAINSAIESVSKWKWPSGESINNRNTVLVHSAPMKLANATPNKPTHSAFPQDNKQSMSKWLSSLLVTSINNAIAQKKAQNSHVHQHSSYKPEVDLNEIKEKPVESVQPFVGKEVVNTKGHKTTIITGSSVRQQQLKNSQVHQANQNVKLPPEFTVSSHGIRLQVAPKSRVQSARFVRNYQGVDVEMDDEDGANLSELIMKHYPVVPKRSQFK